MLTKTVIDENNASLPARIFPEDACLNTVSVTPEEVKSVLQTLKLGKSSGPDNINNRILKELAIPLSKPLSDLFNCSLINRQCPDVWKEATVSPLYKKDDPSLVSNYRPISLLNTIGKVMEKIIHKHIFNFFSENNIYF